MLYGPTDHVYFLTVKSQHSGVPWPGFFQEQETEGMQSLISLCPLGKQGSQGNHYWYQLKDGGQQVHWTGSEVTPSILTTASRPPREDHTSALLMRQPGTAQCAQHQEPGEVIPGKRRKTQTKCGRYEIVLVGLNPASQSLLVQYPALTFGTYRTALPLNLLLSLWAWARNSNYFFFLMLVFIYMEGVT